MTKPQTGPEPSMEDILASIRKMISEERNGPRPLPDQMARTPFGERTAGRPAARPADWEADPAPVERTAPSFSSLSDALKNVTPERRSLDEKIADMLDEGIGGAAPSDSLAVFSGGRSAHAEPGRAGRAPLSGRGDAAQPPGPQQGSSLRGREASLNGAARNGEPLDDPGAAAGQRIIAMPARFPVGLGSGPAPATGQGLNGANVSVLGLRSVPGGPAAASGSEAPGPDKADASAPRAEAAKEGSAKRSDDAGVIVLPSAEPRTANREDARAAQPPAVPKAGDEPEIDLDTLLPPVQAPAASSSQEALLDAVMDLVHKEPETLSVFTSGSAFMHGVPTRSAAADPGKPGEGRKLDRAAAELLRPMLRQWLSDNMPRIVEEALRSELKSSDKG